MSIEQKSNGGEVTGLDEENVCQDLLLKSQEGEGFTVPKKVAIMSELVKTMAEGMSLHRTLALIAVTLTPPSSSSTLALFTAPGTNFSHVCFHRIIHMSNICILYASLYR